jgi:glutamate dehydrogenase (NAD(P)+)
VICAAVEFAGGTEADARERIVEKVGENTRAVLEAVRDTGVEPRAAALQLARSRIQNRVEAK